MCVVCLKTYVRRPLFYTLVYKPADALSNLPTNEKNSVEKIYFIRAADLMFSSLFFLHRVRHSFSFTIIFPHILMPGQDIFPSVLSRCNRLRFHGFPVYKSFSFVVTLFPCFKMAGHAHVLFTLEITRRQHGSLIHFLPIEPPETLALCGGKY